MLYKCLFKTRYHLPYIAYPISHLQTYITYIFNLISHPFRDDTWSMVKLYDIMNKTCLDLYHLLYQPLTCITTRAGGPWSDIGVSGWYSMWYRFWHVMFSIYLECNMIYFWCSWYAHPCIASKNLYHTTNQNPLS